MLNIVKNTTITSILDLLAPHSCRGCGHVSTILCDRCKKYILDSQRNVCPHCKNKNPTGDCPHCPDLPPTFIGGERTGLLGDLIKSYKYQSIRALAHPLAEIIHHALPNTTNQTYLVPLPTISRHIRTRGFDHTALIAKHLAMLQGPNCHFYPLLTRTNNTTQVGQDQTTRLRQASSAYAVSPKFTINPSATYILLDDVWTTGASMLAALKKLQQAGAKDIKLALLSLNRLD